MEYNHKNWPYKWFGLWKEYGDGYAQCPSIKGFVDHEVNQSYDKVRILEYLNSGFAFVATSRHNFPSPFTGEIKGGSICLVTDGIWLWQDTISEYILENGLVIPSAMYAHMARNNFKIPNMEALLNKDFDFSTLEWPKQ